MGRIRPRFQRSQPLKEGKEKRSWEDVTDVTDELARELVRKSRAYGKRLDLKVGGRASQDEGEGEPFMHAFINGRHYDVDDVRSQQDKQLKWILKGCIGVHGIAANGRRQFLQLLRPEGLFSPPFSIYKD